MAYKGRNPFPAPTCGEVATAKASSRLFERRPARVGCFLDGAEEPAGRDIVEIRDELERRLAWYGLHSVKVGPLRRLGDNTILADLLDGRDTLLCCVELDQESGRIRPAARRDLSSLISSLGFATRESVGF